MRPIRENPPKQHILNIISASKFRGGAVYRASLSSISGVQPYRFSHGRGRTQSSCLKAVEACRPTDMVLLQSMLCPFHR